MSLQPVRRWPGPRLPTAWSALAVSVLAHGLAVLAIAGSPSCPPVLPRIVLTAALAPAGCGSGPAGPAAAAADPVPAPEVAHSPPEPDQPSQEVIAAKDVAPGAVVAPREKRVPVAEKRPRPVRHKPAVTAREPRPEPVPREVAAVSPRPSGTAGDPQAVGPGGGSGASSGPPSPSGGGAGAGSIGAPLSAGELDMQPSLVFAPKPEYPFQAKRRGLRGKLRVRLLVDTAGRVERVDILGGENVEEFAENVRTALVRWRFKPGTQKGTPVHWVAILPIAFEHE